MDLLATFVVLRRRWVLVCFGALASVALGVFAGYRVSIAPPQLGSRATESGAATVKVLVDTRRPLLAAARTLGDDTIVSRAALLGSLLAQDDFRLRIASAAGVKPSELAIYNPSLGAPIATPLSRSAVEISRPVAPDLLTVSAEDARVPIVSITAETQDPAAAEPLANAATAALGSLARGAVAGDGPPLRLERLGPVATESVAARSGALKAIAVAVVLFALWCTAVVVLDRIGRRPRTPSAPRPNGHHPTRQLAGAGGPYARTHDGRAHVARRGR
jgi:hypothetical protein